MKIALVDFLNAAPLWWGLRAGLRPNDWELCFETPARCADMLESGEAGVGILPSLELDRIRGLIMPAPLGVACSGAVRSVLLFHGGPVEGIRRVLLDPTSRTSQGLVKILLAGRITGEPAYEEVRWDGEELPGDTAALVIGDRALQLGTDRPREWVMDLGRAWVEGTGLPFVFAAWASRVENSGEDVSEVLQGSYDYGATHREEIVAEYSTRLNLPEESVRDYLTVSLHHAFEPEDLRGLELFWERARRTSKQPEGF